jgi:hypothetical protein
MSSPRLNSVAKKAQRRLVVARQLAFDQTLGQTVRCGACGNDFTLTLSSYRGIVVRDRVHVEAVRYACHHCGVEMAVMIDESDVS